MGRSRSARTPVKFRDATRRMSSGQLPEVGAIFMSNTSTKEECLEKMLFGLPHSHVDFVRRVKAGMILFLFEYEQRELHGVFEAASDGEINIISSAYTSSGKQFPAQVQVSRIWHCYPLSEREFRGVIRDNYFSANKFNFGLSYDQVHQLLCLFDSRKIGESKDTESNSCATTEFVERHRRPLHFDGITEGTHLANTNAEIGSSHPTAKLSVYPERTLPEDCFSPASTMDKSSTCGVSCDVFSLAYPSPSQTRQNSREVENQCANALGSQSIQRSSVPRNNACSCSNAELGDFIPLSFDDNVNPLEDKDEDEDESMLPSLWTENLCFEPYDPIISGADSFVGLSELSTLNPLKNIFPTIGESSSAIIPFRLMPDHQMKADSNRLNSLCGCQGNGNSGDSDDVPQVRCLYSDTSLPNKKGSVFSRLKTGTLQGQHNPVDVVISVDDIMEKLQLKHEAWMKTAEKENPALKAGAVTNSRNSVFKRLGKPLESGLSEGQCDFDQKKKKEGQCDWKVSIGGSKSTRKKTKYTVL